MHQLRFVGLFISVLVMCSAWALLPKVAVAQEYTQLFAAVVDEDGEPVLDLTANDFEFKIDGKEIPLAYARLDTVTPKIAIMVDTGDGMYNARVDSPLRNGLENFLNTLVTEEANNERNTNRFFAPPPVLKYNVGIFTIGAQVRQLEDFTTDREELRETAGGIFTLASEGTRLMDGLFETWERRFTTTDPWPVFVLIVGPGEDHSNFVTQNEYSDFIDDLYTRQATVHAIIVNNTDLRGMGGGVDMFQYASNIVENTGGRLLTVSTVSALPDSLTELAEHVNNHAQQVSSRYRIVHEVPDDIGRGDIAADLIRPGLTLQLFLNRSLAQ